MVDQNLCKTVLEKTLSTTFDQHIFLFLCPLKNIKKICHFVTFEKSKMTCLFDDNQAARPPYLYAFY